MKGKDTPGEERKNVHMDNSEQTPGPNQTPQEFQVSEALLRDLGNRQISSLDETILQRLVAAQPCDDDHSWPTYNLSKTRMLEIFDYQLRRMDALLGETSDGTGTAMYKASTFWINDFIHEEGTPDFAEFERLHQSLIVIPPDKLTDESLIAANQSALKKLRPYVLQFFDKIEKSEATEYVINKAFNPFTDKNSPFSFRPTAQMRASEKNTLK